MSFKKPVENISMHGMVLDLGKKKMSKSLGNIIAPKQIIEKYGRDYLRYYFARTSKGEDFAFDEDEFKEIQKIFMMLLNINNFINQIGKGKKNERIEDKWIISRFNALVDDVTKGYNAYNLPEVVQKIEDFLLNDLSRKYIQIIRERDSEVYDILNEIRLGIMKLISPIAPFLTEQIWQTLREKKIVNEESIHLSDWPKFEKKIDKKIEEQFEAAMKIIESGLGKRDEAKIGLRWPLAKLTISFSEKLNKDFEQIIAKQLNVKKIE